MTTVDKRRLPRCDVAITDLHHCGDCVRVCCPSGLGFDVGGVDGRYGPKSESAVKDLQQRFQITVDGVVGPQTWGTRRTAWRKLT